MTISLTKDWQLKLEPLVEHLIVKVFIPNYKVTYRSVGDDREDVEPEIDDDDLYAAVEDLLCNLIEEIEERSSFEANRDLPGVVRTLTQDKSSPAWRLAWAGVKITGRPQWTGD